MDALEALIAAKRKDIVDVEAQIASHETAITRLRDGLKLAHVELAAFEKAARLRPTGKPNLNESASDHAGGKKRGRQPGSISFPWRKALGSLYGLGERFHYELMLNAAHQSNIKRSEAKVIAGTRP